MTYLNNNMNKSCQHLIAVVATIFALAIIMVASSTGTSPIAATTTPTMTNNNTITTPSSSGIKLSPQPIYEERSPSGTITVINETHGVNTFSGNGMLTLPNTTHTINTTHNGTAVLSFTTTSGQGKETIRTEDGETATATVYEIVQFNNPTAQGGEGKGIVTAIFQTNSTGVLAPLNGMIAVGIDEFSPADESHITLWKWESGIPLPSGSATGTEERPSSPLMNTTTTNTTISSGTNASTATGEESVEEEAVGGAEVAE